MVKAEIVSFIPEIEVLHVVFTRNIAPLMVKLIYQGSHGVKTQKHLLQLLL